MTRLPDLLDLLTVPLLLALVSFAGAALLGGCEAGRTIAYRLALRAVAGTLALFVWLQVLDLMGVRWRLASVLAPLPALAMISLVRIHRSRRTPQAWRWRWPDWGEVLVLGALGGLAVLLLRPCLTMPDVVFHWGLKAQRDVLAGGIDHEFLKRPWNFNKHADYPHLVPDLYAVGALLRGRFTEATFLPWTLANLGLMAIAVREVFTHPRRFPAQAALVITLYATVAFTISHMLGGSPDLLLAAVVVAAIAPLLDEPREAGDGCGIERRQALCARDWQIALLAALAAGVKYEGMTLAAWLVLARLWQRWRLGARVGPRIVARLAAAPALVAGLWWLDVMRFGLAQGNRAGSFDAGHAGAIARGVMHALGHPDWHGFGWFVLLVPALLLVPRVRLLAAVLAAQLAVYLWVYFTTPLDVAVLVATSAERLLLHAVPATLVLGGLVLGERKISSQRASGGQAARGAVA